VNLQYAGRAPVKISMKSAPTRRAKVEVLEGEHDQRPVVMVEFPDMEAIHAFWNSPDYVPIKKLREGIAALNI
jgi:uncharacterized protein (DUF1330 family)